MSEPLWQPRTDRAARFLGTGFFLGGLALVGYQIKVIHAAIVARAEHVTYFLAAFALGGMAAALGVYWLVRGLAGYQALRALQADAARMKKVSIVTIIVMVAVLGGLKVWLSSLGYED